MKTFHDPNGADKTTKAIATQIKDFDTGGAGIQPRMKAKPVKNSNCHPKGLKNHWRSDQGSAGRASAPVWAMNQMATQTAAISQKLTR